MLKYLFRREPAINKPLKILLATNSVILIAGAMLGPIYALFAEEIGGDLLTAALAFSLYGLAAGVVIVAVGKFEDKIKETELAVVVGYLIIALSFLAYLLVRTPWHLFGVQILIGIGEAIYSPAFDALFSKHLTRHKYTSGWGAWEAMQYFATTIGALAGGLIANYYGFDYLFVAMGCLSLLSAIYILFLPRKVL